MSDDDWLDDAVSAYQARNDLRERLTRASDQFEQQSKQYREHVDRVINLLDRPLPIAEDQVVEALLALGAKIREFGWTQFQGDHSRYHAYPLGMKNRPERKVTIKIVELAVASKAVELKDLVNRILATPLKHELTYHVRDVLGDLKGKAMLGPDEVSSPNLTKGESQNASVASGQSVETLEGCVAAALDARGVDQSNADDLKPAQRRNIVMFHWQESEELRPAAIRDRWMERGYEPKLNVEKSMSTLLDQVKTNICRGKDALSKLEKN